MVYDFFEELKDIIKEKIKELYIKFKYFLLVFVFILLVLCIFLCVKEEPKTIETQQLKLFEITLENWAQWITIITIPYTAGWAFYQFKKSIIAKKQEKAVEIAKEFSATLVEDLSLINTVYWNSQLKYFIPSEEKMVTQIKYFDVEEVRRVFKNDSYVEKYNKNRSCCLEQLDILYHLELYKNISSYSEFKEIEKLEEKAIRNELTIEEKTKIEEKIKNVSNLPYHFFELVSRTLNKLEYICMDISSKAADSNYIYQSLHQMFLRAIRALYLEISCVNINSADKVYTNIIHVYNIWRDKYLKDKKIEERKIKKANEKLKPKIKTV